MEHKDISDIDCKNASNLKQNLNTLIEDVAQKFHSHPGFMIDEHSIKILHADWPAYPVGQGFRQALRAFGEFPSSTRFYPIDQVDMCTLFVVGKMPEKEPLNTAP